MFLKRQLKEARGEPYDYWSLVRTVRTARGPRHQIVARLGKLDGVEQKAVRCWDQLDALLEGRPIAQQAEFGESAVEPYSRDHRPDCKQVCIGLVVTPEGLPGGSRLMCRCASCPWRCGESWNSG